MPYQTTIRIKIKPDGNITEQVEGVPGAQCAVITSPIENSLGIVTKKENTVDFYKTQERLEILEEEDWRGTCTSWGCAFKKNTTNTQD